jgi:phospholipid transport system substrate-binding protein
MKRGIVALSFVFMVSMAFPLYVHGAAPVDTIETEVNKILDVLRDPALKAPSAKETREERIWAIIDGVFDYAELSKRALGRNWRKFKAEQQKEFTELFSRLLGNVYLDRIMAYTDERIVFGKENMVSEKKAEVESKIVTESKEIPVHYRMILKDGGWKVYDVVIEGVSLVRNYRGQFKEILTNKSPQALIEMLRKKLGKA